jgi:tRNA pseudouridine38-40 synthase
MLEIGEGKKPVEWMVEVLESKNRNEAGSSAAACGLFLTRVQYPDGLWLWPQED